MNQRNKIILIVLGVLLVSGIAFTYANGELFQGRIFRQPSIPANYGCFDLDEKNYYDKGVTYGLMADGKWGNSTDVCLGRTKLKEYYCEGKQKEVKSEEYNCENGCSNGACSKVDIQSLDSILKKFVPLSWIDQFNTDFQISFLVYLPSLNETMSKEEAINLPYDYIEFTDDEKQLLRNAIYKTVYVSSVIDSYFTKELPWTNGQNYYQWLKDSIDHIYFHPGNINSGGNGSVFLSGKSFLANINSGAYESWEKTNEHIGFFNAFIGIFNHEVRHSNAKDHVDCKDMVGLDQSLEYMGSHGINLLWIHWVKHFLPSEMIMEINYLNEGSFDMDAYLLNLCSFDYAGYAGNGFYSPDIYLSEDDRNWLMSVSGYSL